MREKDVLRHLVGYLLGRFAEAAQEPSPKKDRRHLNRTSRAALAEKKPVGDLRAVAVGCPKSRLDGHVDLARSRNKADGRVGGKNDSPPVLTQGDGGKKVELASAVRTDGTRRGEIPSLAFSESNRLHTAHREMPDSKSRKSP